MKIAFTHNLQTVVSEEEAEFDRPETIAAITDALRRLGHNVEPIEVSGPASRLVARLEALNPDLIFNTAEGTKGRFREAFFPALFDRLGIPFTGSDAYVCTITLDKNLSKLMVAPHGVPTPRWKFIYGKKDLKGLDLNFPLICKPNFEGSSIGITQDSIIDDPRTLEDKVENMLRRFPQGMLLEEFIVGRDLVVAFLEKGPKETSGVLEPAVYDYDPEYARDRKYLIYDYEMKSEGFHGVHVRVPADIDAKTRSAVMKHAATVFKVLGVRDLGRIDFRITDKGEIYFLEVNALPSLEEGASIFLSGKLAGLETKEDVIGAVVESAVERQGIDVKSFRKNRIRPKKVRCGITFNIKRIQSSITDNIDDEAEFDNPNTIAAMRKAIESYGFEVVELEANQELPMLLPAAGVDMVFNVAEGFGGRTREAQVPALLELLGIPYTGSDTTSISVCHDKVLAKKIVAQAGIPTAPFTVMTTGNEPIPRDLIYPLIVKPNNEGSSKGVHVSSVVTSEKELRDTVKNYVQKYRQPILVESFLSGREFTVGLLGEIRPKVLPVLEVVFTNNQQKYPVYSFASKIDDSDVRFEVPANINGTLQKKLTTLARRAFASLGCRDYARIDFRLDSAENPIFLECNPLPGLVPEFSDLCVMAKAAGIDYRNLLGEMMSPAQRRYRELLKRRLIGIGDQA